MSTHLDLHQHWEPDGRLNLESLLQVTGAFGSIDTIECGRIRA